jgi:DnaJ-class molecular chaperone
MKKKCKACNGEGWFITSNGTIMCSKCRGKGR